VRACRSAAGGLRLACGNATASIRDSPRCAGNSPPILAAEDDRNPGPGASRRGAAGPIPIIASRSAAFAAEASRGGGPLSVDIEQHRDELAEWAESALADGQLAEPWQVSVCPLCDFPQSRAFGDGDRVAAVVQRFDGELPLTGVFVMEPEDALVVARELAGGGDPLDAYVDRGRAVLEALVVRAAELHEATAIPGTAVLAEEPLLPILAATHAPPDVRVLSVALLVELGERSLAATAHVLIESKPLGLLVRALSG